VCWTLVSALVITIDPDYAAVTFSTFFGADFDLAIYRDGTFGN
jgi:hypothetical protein